MSPDLSQFQRPSDSVTPTKWRGPDGRVWERTGEKCQPKPGEFIWFDTGQPEPYAFIENWDVPEEIYTPIWKLSENQAWDPGEVKPVGPPSIEELIQQAQFSEDPLALQRLLVLATLYHAREAQAAVEFATSHPSKQARADLDFMANHPAILHPRRTPPEWKYPGIEVLLACVQVGLLLWVLILLYRL